MLNVSEQRTYRNYVLLNKASILMALKTGQGRGGDAKEANYREILYYLAQSRIQKNTADIVGQAAGITAEVIGRVVEVQEPPRDNGAARELAMLEGGSSNVKATLHDVDVRLDNDQNKHQHPTVPIGNRQKGGGNRFINTCDADWHIATTLEHMATWAEALGPMAAGQKEYHGQFVPVNGIHYEGFCLFAGGKKHVLFHCYPADGSPLLLG